MRTPAPILSGAIAALVSIIAVSGCSATTVAGQAAPAETTSSTATPMDSYIAEIEGNPAISWTDQRSEQLDLGWAICADAGTRSRESIVVELTSPPKPWPRSSAEIVVDAAKRHLCPATVWGPGTPTATPAAAPTQPAPAAPRVFEGKGDDVITLDKADGVAVFDFACPRCSGNVVVKTDGRDTLLVNEIGSYEGRHLIDHYDGSVTSTVEIKATGSWKLTVTEGMDALRNSNGAAISGTGDDVVVITHPSATKARIENRKGDSNFVVWLISSAGGYRPDLAVNTIGGYSGTVRMTTPAVAIVTSDGEWSITPG